MPSVSVIVPNYNHAAYLSRRLDSILGQTFTDFEIIILDDASSDSSHEVIARYLTEPRIRFYPNQANSGSPFAQWNRGIELAHGEFIWLAESDDYADPAFLATMVPLLRQNPRLGFAYCQSWRVDSLNHPSGTLEDWTKDLDAGRWQKNFINAGPDECKNYLFWKNTVPNASAVLLRKDIFLRSGGAPVDMRLCGDWMTWVRMLLISDVAFTPLRLNYFRKHDAAVRETTSDRRHFDEKWTVQRFVLRSCKVAASARRELARQILDEFMARVRRRPFSEKWRQAVQGIKLFWPIFVRAPLTVFYLTLGRFFKKISAGA